MGCGGGWLVARGGEGGGQADSLRVIPGLKLAVHCHKPLTNPVVVHLHRGVTAYKLKVVQNWTGVRGWRERERERGREGEGEGRERGRG
jgi:hypothetical protein